MLAAVDLTSPFGLGLGLEPSLLKLTGTVEKETGERDPLIVVVDRSGVKMNESVKMEIMHRRRLI